MVATSEPSPSLDPKGNGNKVGSTNFAGLNSAPIKRQKKKKERGIDLPEELVINIMARLPPQSVVRFKLVCREWKSLTESSFFRDLYHINFSSTSSSNWSIFHGDHKSLHHSRLEELKLDLPRELSSHCGSSFASCFTQNKNKMKEIRVVACTDGLVLLCLEPDDDEEEDMMIRYYIGNPVLPQWIQLPPPSLPRRDVPYHWGFNDSGLVTRMHNGALLGYKVVRIHSEAFFKMSFSRTWSFEIFSSDTGEWSVKQVPCPGRGVHMLRTSNPVSLSGKLHWLHDSWLDDSRLDDSCRIIVHDFFSHDNQVRAICLPARMQGTGWLPADPRGDMIFHPSPLGKMICTTSQGYFVLVDVGLIEEVKSYNVRVWRLKCDSWNWEKAWEINMACVGLGRRCVPMAINCFDIDIIYLWDLDRKCFLACNLRTNTKSYGTRKDGTAVYKDRSTYIFPNPFEEDGFVYKEDTFCYEPHPCLLQFVPSLQVVPT